MKTHMKTTKYAKHTLSAIVLALLVFGLFLAYSTICDYQPGASETIAENSDCAPIDINDEISVLTWNIGYAGLDRGMDFFYDGGTKMRPAKPQSEENLRNIASFLAGNDTIQFFLLQEVDKNAKRSYGQNQVDTFHKTLSSHTSCFALNYNVGFVPIPITEPMGGVQSGIQTLSKSRPRAATRTAFPFNFDWPLKVFMLDRCFITSYHPLSNGKELVIVNTHNSAFDENGEIRKSELNLFRDFLLKEYEKGNYVIAGGDFNQSPPSLSPSFGHEPFDHDDYVAIPDTLFPQGWTYAFDNEKPSNRRVIEAYQPGLTKVTLIDFFITSPNVEVNEVKCINLGFEHSDHNPVIGSFSLKPGRGEE